MEKHFEHNERKPRQWNDSRGASASSLAIAALAGTMVAAPVGAADSVTQTVNAGTLTASIADLTLTAVNYSHSAQTNTGTMTLTADDSRGNGAGWNVTVQSGNFVSGSNSIAASNFSLTSAAAPARTAGQAIDATGTDASPKGPQLGTLAGVSGTLDTARKTIRAGADFGQGTYTQALSVSLNIPATQKAGTYVAALTVSVTSGP